MRAIYTQFSGLAGLLAFLNQLWNYAPIERTILIGFGTGLVIYLLLILGDATITRILEYTPTRLADETAGPARASGAASKPSEGKDAARASSPAA